MTVAPSECAFANSAIGRGNVADDDDCGSPIPCRPAGKESSKAGSTGTVEGHDDHGEWVRGLMLPTCCHIHVASACSPLWSPVRKNMLRARQKRGRGHRSKTVRLGRRVSSHASRVLAIDGDLADAERGTAATSARATTTPRRVGGYSLRRHRSARGRDGCRSAEGDLTRRSAVRDRRARAGPRHGVLSSASKTWTYLVRRDAGRARRARRRDPRRGARPPRRRPARPRPDAFDRVPGT